MARVVRRRMGVFRGMIPSGDNEVGRETVEEGSCDVQFNHGEASIENVSR